MNITKKRLHKIKKSNNQSKRYIHKKSNKKKRKNKVSKGKKRSHNLKNKTLKINRYGINKNKQGRKPSIVVKNKIGGNKDNDDITKILWTPTSEDDNTSVDIDDIELWTPASEEVNAEEAEEENEEEAEEEEEEAAEEAEAEEGEKGNEEGEVDSKNDSVDKKEANNKILLENLSNSENWSIFMDTLLTSVCEIENKLGEKDDIEETKDPDDIRYEEGAKDGEDVQDREDDSNISNKLLDEFNKYYSKENDNNEDDLYKKAKIYYDNIKDDNNNDNNCGMLKYTSKYDDLKSMMEDTDNATSVKKSVKLIAEIHNLVVDNTKDNIVEKIINKKEITDGEIKSDDKKDALTVWFKEFKTQMTSAQYEIEENVFIPKTNVLLTLNFSNEDNAKSDVSTRFKSRKSPSDDVVGDLVQEIIYNLSDHKKQANDVKKKLTEKSKQ